VKRKIVSGSWSGSVASVEKVGKLRFGPKAEKEKVGCFGASLTFAIVRGTINFVQIKTRWFDPSFLNWAQATKSVAHVPAWHLVFVGHRIFGLRLLLLLFQQLLRLSFIALQHHLKRGDVLD
jgi:hypothetical protein